MREARDRSGECFGTGYFGESYTFRTNANATCSTNGNVNQRRREFVAGTATARRPREPYPVLTDWSGRVS